MNHYFGSCANYVYMYVTVSAFFFFVNPGLHIENGAGERGIHRLSRCVCGGEGGQ